MSTQLKDILDTIEQMANVGRANRVQNPTVSARQHENVIGVIQKYRRECEAEAAPIPDGSPLEISVALLAEAEHGRWLAQKDRSYSDMGRPWDELTDEQKAATTLQTIRIARGTIDEIGLVGIVIEEEMSAESETGPKSETATNVENAEANRIAQAEAKRDGGGAPVDLTDKDKATPAGADPAPAEPL